MRRRTWCCLALSLLLPCAGCSLFKKDGLAHFFKKDGGTQANGGKGPSVFGDGQLHTDESKVAKAQKPKDGAKRQPKADTCFRAGQCLEQVADTANDNPALRKQRYDEARLAYQQALEIDATHPGALLSLALLHDKLGNYELAVAAYHNAVNRYPKDASFQFQLGMCWGRQKQWKSSVECLQKAVELDPTNTTYSNHLGCALARSGRFPEAFEHFRRTVGEAQANYNLALMMNHLGQPDAARQYAQAALTAKPQMREAEELLSRLDAAGEVQQTNHESPPQPESTTPTQP